MATLFLSPASIGTRLWLAPSNVPSLLPLPELIAKLRLTTQNKLRLCNGKLYYVKVAAPA